MREIDIESERFFWLSAAAVFAILAGVNYLPVFLGKIPFPPRLGRFREIRRLAALRGHWRPGHILLSVSRDCISIDPRRNTPALESILPGGRAISGGFSKLFILSAEFFLLRPTAADRLDRVPDGKDVSCGSLYDSLCSIHRRNEGGSCLFRNHLRLVWLHNRVAGPTAG